MYARCCGARVRFNQNSKIRLHILSIAFIGGLGFFCYLLTNVFMASQNERRLEDLLNRQYPIIEQVSCGDGVLLQIRDPLLNRMKSGGQLLLSGILVEHENDFFREFLQGTDLKVLKRLEKEEWIAALIG